MKTYQHYIDGAYVDPAGGEPVSLSDGLDDHGALGGHDPFGPSQVHAQAW